MILILAGLAHDPSVVRISEILQEHGEPPLVITPECLEQLSSLSITADSANGARCVLHLPERDVDLREVRAAWLWRGWQPNPLEARFRTLAKTPPAWDFFTREWQAFHKGISLVLAEQGAFCVNPPPFNTAFEEKCAQLLLAAEVGLAIPPTLYTTRLPVTREFCRDHGGAIVYKPFRPYLHVADPRDDGPVAVERLLTNRVGMSDLVEGDGFVPTPSIFQPYVPKRLELRIVVVGRQIFACAIHSQQSERSQDDWRRYDFDNTPYEPYDLPDDICRKIRHLMDRLRLVFGSIDMIVTPDGEHVFLEVNPNGQFDFIARLTGLPIYEHLAALLLTRSTEYSGAAIKEVEHAV